MYAYYSKMAKSKALVLSGVSKLSIWATLKFPLNTDITPMNILLKSSKILTGTIKKLLSFPQQPYIMASFTLLQRLRVMHFPIAQN